MEISLKLMFDRLSTLNIQEPRDMFIAAISTGCDHTQVPFSGVFSVDP